MLKIFINLCLCGPPTHAEIVVERADGSKHACGFFASKEALLAFTEEIKKHYALPENEADKIRTKIKSIEQLFETEEALLRSLKIQPKPKGKYFILSHSETPPILN